MNLFKSLRYKTLALLLVSSIVILFIGSYFLWIMGQTREKASIITEGEINKSRAIHQILLTISGVRHSLYLSILVNDFDDMQTVRDQESVFNKANLDFNMFIKAIIWGSDSEAFKKSDAGIVNTEWLRQGFDKKYKIPKAS